MTSPAITERDRLASLFSPDRVAVVGASEGKFFSDSLVRPMLSGPPAPDLVLVNRNRPEVYGRATVSALADVTEPVDCVVSLLPGRAALDVLPQAAAIGATAAVVVASGFGEDGPAGAVLQEELATVANEHGIALCGPNCNGLIGVRAGANLFIGPQYCRPLPGPISVISQSGALLPPLLLAGHERGVGWSRIVSSGNEAVLDLCDYLESFLDDEGTTVICCIVEELRDVGRFVALSGRAREVGKDIIALKLGVSERGQALASSHTGAVAGDSSLYGGLFAQCGVVAVESLDEMIDAALVLSQVPCLPDVAAAGLSVISVSGGATELVADLAERHDVPLADWGADMQFTAMEGAAARAPQNPHDLTGFAVGSPEAYREILERVLALEQTTALLVIWDVRESHRQWFEPLPELGRRSGKPIVIVAPIGANPEPWAREWIVEETTVAVGYALPGTMVALGARLRPAAATDESPPARLAEVEGPNDFVAGFALLERAGIPVAPYGLVGSGMAASSLEQPGEPPYIAKLADVPHRTALKAVRGPLVLSELSSAVDELRDVARVHEVADRVLVQPFIRGDAELYVGGLRDDRLGTFVLFGIGGYLLEPLRDVSARRIPFGHREAERMILSLRARKLFRGYRGEDAWDLEALVGAVLGMQDLMRALGSRVRSVDVNPLIVRDGRPEAVDVLFEMTNQGT